MKTFVFVLGLLSSVQAFALGGTVGNGGDSYVMEFIATGERVSKWLEIEGIKELSGLNSVSFTQFLRSAKISSTDSVLYLDGVEKDAINYPSTGEIVFNRKRWKSIQSDFQRVGIVIHEVLGLMNINDLAYKVSIPLAARITGVDPQKTPFFKINFTCDSYANVIKSDGTELQDIQRVVVGYNPYSLGIQPVNHSIDGHIYYMGVSVGSGLGLDSQNPDREYWSVEYYRATAPMDASLNFKILGETSFYAIGEELPAKFILSLEKILSPNKESQISFRLKCQRN